MLLNPSSIVHVAQVSTLRGEEAVPVVNDERVSSLRARVAERFCARGDLCTPTLVRLVKGDTADLKDDMTVFVGAAGIGENITAVRLDLVPTAIKKFQASLDFVKDRASLHGLSFSVGGVEGELLINRATGNVAVRILTCLSGVYNKTNYVYDLTMDKVDRVGPSLSIPTREQFESSRCVPLASFLLGSSLECPGVRFRMALSAYVGRDQRYKSSAEMAVHNVPTEELTMVLMRSSPNNYTREQVSIPKWFSSATITSYTNPKDMTIEELTKENERWKQINLEMMNELMQQENEKLKAKLEESNRMGGSWPQVDLDLAGRVLRDIPEQDNEGISPKEHCISVKDLRNNSYLANDCDVGFSQECTREDIFGSLHQTYSSQLSNIYRKGSPFAKLPEKWKHDRLVAFKAMDLDPTGRVLRDIPEQDNEGKPLRDDKELVMKGVRKAGTNLAYVKSESLRNDPEVVLAAVAHTARACKYIGGELKKDKQFVKDMLGEIIKHKGSIDYTMEPQRAKVTKHCFAFPKSWPGNLSAGCNDLEFEDGTFEIPIGTNVGEAMEQRGEQVITRNAYAGQNEIIEGIDESVLHDPEVLKSIFEVDCVALLFNDLARKELARGPDTSQPMRLKWKKIVDEWHNHHEIQRPPVERLYCWVDPSIWQPKDDIPIAVADSIHFWMECVRRTNNPSLLAEAPKDMLIDEEKMLEALRKDVNLFNVMPWKLRVSETFNAKLQDAFPGTFLWITLEDRRAKIPSKARDSEMGEMIAAFAAVQKRTGKLQQQVPFLQVADVLSAPGLQPTALP